MSPLWIYLFIRFLCMILHHRYQFQCNFIWIICMFPEAYYNPEQVMYMGFLSVWWIRIILFVSWLINNLFPTIDNISTEISIKYRERNCWWRIYAHLILINIEICTKYFNISYEIIESKWEEESFKSEPEITG